MEFTVRRKGYDRTEVDLYLKDMQNEYEALQNEVFKLRRRLEEADSEKHFLEKQKMLIEETMINAEFSARRTIEDAEAKARDIAEKQKFDYENADKDIEAKKQELKALLKRVEYILKSQLALLENNENENGQ